MPASLDVRILVDKLLASPKQPVGQAFWIDDHREGDQRLLYPLLVEGEISDATLTIIAFPRIKGLQFRLVLSYGRAIWRLDFVDFEEHFNSFNKPDDLELGPFTCPHYHAWIDNRRFATRTTLPVRLENARILDANLKSFDNTFRWFCGQTKIDIAELGVPTLPTTDRFL
jgi:hypothetical protein